MDHNTLPPNLPAAVPSAVEVAPPVAQYRNPLIDTPQLPSALHRTKQGRGFFTIEKRPSGQWRAICNNNKGRVTAWRDFGTTAEDYLRAWEWANESVSP